MPAPCIPTPLALCPFSDLGGAIGDMLKNLVATAFETAMLAIWKVSLGALHLAFALADEFSVFTVDIHSGPVSILWPMMLWLSGVLALGLFFWQLIMVNLRGGAGFMRLVSGPVQYGIALALTVGLVAVFLTAVDGLTNGILMYGLQSENFTQALGHTTFGGEVENGIDAIALGFCGILGVLPSAFGYVLEMLFREAAVFVLVATIPIAAAGLLANVTAHWYWKTCRWLLAAIAMKPLLALTLVLGVAIVGGSRGLAGLLAGVGVLTISLLCPFVLFRLFAFVDPNTDAGAGFRSALSGVGVDSYGKKNPAIKAFNALRNRGSGGGDDGGDDGEGDAQEDANTSRFDDAASSQSTQSMDNTGVGSASSNGGGGDGGKPTGSGSGAQESGDADGSGDDTGKAGTGGESAPDSGATGQPPSAGSGDGTDPQPPDPPDHGGSPPLPQPPPPPGDGSSGPKGGGGGAAAGGEEEAAVVIV